MFAGGSRVRVLAGVGSLLLWVGAGVPATGAAGDPLRDRQWGLEQIRAEQAWLVSTGAGAVVAVVDTGVDLDHPDLQGQLVPGATFTCGSRSRPCGAGGYRGPDGSHDEDDEHGTHVAGTVAATAGNGIGVAGVAPQARIMPVKVLEAGSGDYGDIATGVRWAVDHGADVVNLSLGGLPGSQAVPITGIDDRLARALDYARDQGALAVAAAGNSATPLCNDPAFTDAVLCVAATDRTEAKAWYSELPNKPDMKAVAAPGGAGLLDCEEDIYSTVPSGTGSRVCGHSDYDAFAGTSMATPHVAGVAALLYAQRLNLAEVEHVLLDTARQPATGERRTYTPTHGWGVVDAAAAVRFDLTPADGYRDLRGTSSGEMLSGTAAPDRILGRGGADVLSGRARGDILAPGTGADRLDAGRGEDRVQLFRDGRADRIDCGGGRDTVTVRTGGRTLRRRHLDRGDAFSACERFRAAP